MTPDTKRWTPSPARWRPSHSRQERRIWKPAFSYRALSPAQEQANHAGAGGEERKRRGQRRRARAASGHVPRIDADNHIVEVSVTTNGNVFEERKGCRPAVDDRKGELDGTVDRHAVDRILVARRNAFKQSRHQARIGAERICLRQRSIRSGFIVEQCSRADRRCRFKYIVIVGFGAHVGIGQRHRRRHEEAITSTSVDTAEDRYGGATGQAKWIAPSRRIEIRLQGRSGSAHQRERRRVRTAYRKQRR